MRGGVLRTRALLDAWFPIVLASFLAAVAIGGWVTYGAHVQPGTQETQRTVEEWSVEGSFSHRATVTGAANGTVFEPGTVVRNRSVYLQRVMPVLEGAFHLDYGGSDVPLDVRVERRLVVRSVDTTVGEEEATVYWEETREREVTETMVRPGGDVAVPFEVNVTRTFRLFRTVNERLGSPGSIQLDVRVTVTATPRTADTRSREATFGLPIRRDGDVYRVDAEPRRETFSRTETVTVRDDPGPLQAVGGPLVLVVGILAATGLAAARWRDALVLSPAEREWLAYRRDRDEFDEWITTVRLPDETAELPVAEADTLRDLVDYAIDTDGSVLESPEGGAYHVVDDGYLYRFEAPPRPGDPPSSDATVPLDGDGERPADAGTTVGEDDGVTSLRDLPTVEAGDVEQLEAAGIETVADLAAASPEELRDTLDVTQEEAERLIVRTRAWVDDGADEVHR